MHNRSGDLECLLLKRSGQHVVRRRFVQHILFMEFMDNLCFRGLMSTLEIFFLENLQFRENVATELVHVVLLSSFCGSLVGSLLCDGFMGKFKAIFAFTAFQLTGELLLLLVTCFPNSELRTSTFFQALLIFALLIIALGHGSTRPCLSSFGGDELYLSEGKLPGDTIQSRGHITPNQQFFSSYFLVGTFGTVVGTLLLPLIRVHSNQSFFFVLLVVLCSKVSGYLVFWLGRKEYRSIFSVSPGVNGGPEVDANTTSVQLVKIHTVRSKIFLKEDLTVMAPTIFVMLSTTLYQSLNLQELSAWVYQAREMDRNVTWLGHWTIQPDQMPVLKPIFTAVVVPLLDRLIYPAVDRHIAKVTNLRKVVVAMLIATVSFVMSGSIQLVIDAEMNEPDRTQSDVSIFWQIPQFLAISTADSMMTIPMMDWAYTEAPESLKALSTGVWMASGGIGNLITVVSFALLGSHAAKAEGSFFFAILGAVGAVTLATLAYYYVPRELRTEKSEDQKDSFSQKGTMPFPLCA